MKVTPTKVNLLGRLVLCRIGGLGAKPAASFQSGSFDCLCPIHLGCLATLSLTDLNLIADVAEDE